MTEDKIFEQLALLKSVTLRTGAIHEAQKVQLLNWPKLIPGVYGNPVVKWKDRSITMECKSKLKRSNPLVKKTCQNIGEWVRCILWDDTKLTIVINDKAVFEL